MQSRTSICGSETSRTGAGAGYCLLSSEGAAGGGALFSQRSGLCTICGAAAEV